MSNRFFSYLLLILLTYALYSYNSYQALLYLLILLIALPLSSFILLLIGRYFVKVNLISDKTRVYRTENFNITLEVENKSPFYFPLMKLEFNLPRNDRILKLEKNSSKKISNLYNFRLYRKPHFVSSNKLISLALPQNALITHNIFLKSKHKGNYKVGTDSIVLQDLFGFFYLPLPKRSIYDRKTHKYTSVINLEVLPNPKIWKLSEFGVLMDPEQILISNNNKKVSNEVDTIAKVRTYQQGDRMKQIHWKLSARNNEWLTREFEDPRQGGILFILDPKIPDSCVDPYNYSNNATEIIAASMRHFSRTEGPLNLLLDETAYSALGEGLEPIKFYEELMYWKGQIKKGDLRLKNNDFQLACNVLENRSSLTEMMDKGLQNKVYRAVVICTARIHDKLINELLRIQESGSQVILLFMHNENQKDLDNTIKKLVRSKVKIITNKVSSLEPYKELGAKEKK